MQKPENQSEKVPSLHLLSSGGSQPGPFYDIEFLRGYHSGIGRAPAVVGLYYSSGTDMATLRDRIIAAGSEGASHVVVFNSPLRATTSPELILEFAWERSKVGNDKILIVDCNLRTPVLNRIYNMAPGVGVAEYLAGTHTLPEVLKRTNLQNVFLIRSGCLKLDPLHLLTSPALPELVTIVEQEFDFILINTPPYRDYVDAFVLARYLQPLFVLSVDGRTSTWTETEAMREELARYHVKILGLVNHM